MLNKEIMGIYFRAREATERLERVRVGKNGEIELLPKNCINFLRRVSIWVTSDSQNRSLKK